MRIHSLGLLLLSWPLSPGATIQEPTPERPLCVPVTVSVDALETGELLRVPFGSEQVGIYHRSEHDIQALEATKPHGVDDKLPGWWPRDSAPPGSKAVATSALRSISRELFVFWIPSAVYGCYVLHVPPPQRLEIDSELPERDLLGADWKGGFFDPCYGNGYDYAGRVVFQPQGEKLPPKSLRDLSLVIPSYQFKPDSRELVLRCK